MSDSVETSDLTNTTPSPDAGGVARLLLHLKDNNVSWMIGVLVAYQIGALDKIITYGSGMC